MTFSWIKYSLILTILSVLSFSSAYAVIMQNLGDIPIQILGQGDNPFSITLPPNSRSQVTSQQLSKMNPTLDLSAPTVALHFAPLK